MLKRFSVRAALAALILLPVAAAGFTASAEPAGAGLRWRPCAPQSAGQCTTIPVPVDWADPGGAKFDLTIGRLPATEPWHRIGVLFVAPGGPGGSGIDSYILNPGFPIGDALRKRFDIVSWDQRGVSRSNEVRCSADLLARAQRPFPSGDKEYRELLAFNAELGADCRKHTGPVFDHIDTTSAVRDLDAIRNALGERKLSFYGASYGTQVGQQYAELFGDRVRAMTIDSNMDHSLRSGSRYIETTSEDLEGSFGEFADWCARTAGCALHGRDVRAVWDDLLAKAEAGKLTDPATGKPLDTEALRSELMGAMYRPATRWFGLGDRLAALAGTAAATPAQPAAADELGQNSYQGIWCEDWKWRVSGAAELRTYRDRAARLAPHTKLSPFWTDVTSCLGWPAKVNNPQHRLSIDDGPPILIAKARYDVATPYRWNLAVADQIDDSVLLEYDGIGHGQYYQSGCIRNHIERYLLTLRTPAPNTHCPAEYPTTRPATTQSLPAPTPKPTH